MSMSYEELESERQYSEWRLEKLQRCLENDYGIRASWDGLRRAWTTESVTAELDYIEDKSRWAQLFGTPERAARTIADACTTDPGDGCIGCPAFGAKCGCGGYDALLEWLKGASDGE